MTTWYRTGTVNLTNQSTAVVGVLTGFLNQVKVGDAFSRDGATWYEVAAVASNTGLTLTTPYLGATVAGATYAIQRTSPLWSLASELAVRVADLLEASTDVLSGTTPPAAGLGGDGSFYIDKTATAFYTKSGGVWSAPTSLTGANGAAATVSIGAVTTGAAGSNASVTNVGTPNAATLNITIPQGAPGANGAAGAAATVAVGAVTTGAAGSNASVTNVGTPNAAILNFAIPRGDTGAGGGGSIIGPPIVILASGQSNIARDEAYSWAPPSNLQVWNWSGVSGAVGTAYVAPSNTVTGVSQAFAAEVAKANPDRSVYLVRIAIGAIGIAQWLPGAASPDMFANIAANIAPALAAVGASTIDTLLWWQGEKDAQNGSTTYATDFEAMVARFRTQSWFKHATPITIFGVNSEARGGANYRAMNATLSRVAATEPETRSFVYTAALPAAMWQPAVDSHMTATGYVTAGQMAAHVFMGQAGRPSTPGMTFDPETGFIGLLGADPVSGLTLAPPSVAMAAMAAASSYPRLISSSASAIAACYENRTAQSANQGTFVNLYHNDGSAMLAGSRLGGFIFGGASSAAALRNSASFEAFADGNWVDGVSYPTTVVLKTTPAGSTGRVERVRFAHNGNIGFSATNPLALLSIGNGSLTDALVPVQLSTAGAGTQINLGINKNGGYGFLLGYLNAMAAFGLNGGAATSLGYFRQVTADPFAIVVNNSSPSTMWLSDGSVGVGGTITNTATLAGAAVVVKGSGNVGFGTTAPTAIVDNAGDTYRQRLSRTPASATAAGNTGDMCWDANFHYVCVAPNTWKRAALTAW